MSIDFDDTQYQFSHGHSPRGRGSWAFALDRKMLEPIWAPSNLTYRDAKGWIRAHVRERYGNAPGTLYVCP